MWRYDCKCEAQIRSIGWKHGYRNGTNPLKDLSERKNATNEMLRNHLELEHWKKRTFNSRSPSQIMLFNIHINKITYFNIHNIAIALQKI